MTKTSSKKTRDCENGGITITTPYICTLNTADQTSSCFGDSGSPLLYEGKQIGITSTGVSWEDCSPDFPQAYTDITPYIPWINLQLNGPPEQLAYHQYMPLTSSRW